ncbi:MAG: DUF4249 domain-containing protein [Chitinophagales bacterium]|nr:DUF4249 domain-containing protein [Bacteroidota bacterium]MCB9043863.1 DUF4249 domain-containing protein [Chitinophagales bacterium]
MFKQAIFWSVLFMFFLSACGSLEKEITVDLPEYEKQYIVEGYLEANKPFRLLLTHSSGYFDAITESVIDDVLVNDALVTISYGETVDTLHPNGGFPLYIEDDKLFNYGSENMVPELYNTPFDLNIETADGKKMWASTQLLPAISIDSVTFRKNADSMALVLTYVSDPVNEANFYRRMAYFNNMDSLEQDFVTDDAVVGEKNQIVFGTAYNYAPNDTAINILYHITQDYYDYFRTMQSAVSSNGNPFAIPSSIISNIQGDGIGIFTSLTKTEVIKVYE